MPFYNTRKIGRELQEARLHIEGIINDFQKIKDERNNHSTDAAGIAAADKLRTATVKKYRDIVREQAHSLLNGPNNGVGESSMLGWITNNIEIITILNSEDFSQTMPGSEIAKIQEKCKSSLAMANRFIDYCQNMLPEVDDEMIYDEMRQRIEEVRDNYYDVYFNDPTVGGSVAEPEREEQLKEEIPTPVINREQLNAAYRAYHTENLSFFNSIRELVEFDVDKKVYYNREAHVLYSEDEGNLLPQGEKTRYDTRNKQLIEEGKHFAELKYRKAHAGENITNEQIKKVRDDAEKHVKAEIDTRENKMKDSRSADLLHVAKYGREFSRTFNDRWEQILKDNQEELKKETFALLKGPKSLNANDMAQWSFETVHARTIFAIAFENGKTVINKETDAALKASVELGTKFQRQCDNVGIAHSNAEYDSLDFKFTDVSKDENFTVDDSINMDVFAEDGTILWDSKSNNFKKADAEALFKQVRDNYTLHQNDPEMLPYKEKAMENDNSIDGVIASLKDFRRELKATDPFYVRNSDNFRKLKDELSNTIDALKKFKEHPLDSRMASVKETLGKLQKAADAYTVQKNNESNLNDRSSKRLGITTRLNEFTAKTITRDLSKEWGAANRKTLDTQVNTAKKMARDLLFIKTTIGNENVKKAFADAVTTFKKFPEADVKDARNELATAIGCAVQATKNTGDSFLDLEEFSDIKDDMVALAKRGAKQIEQAKKASGIADPDQVKKTDKKKEAAEVLDDELDDDMDSVYGDGEFAGLDY